MYRRQATARRNRWSAVWKVPITWNWHLNANRLFPLALLASQSTTNKGSNNIAKHVKHRGWQVYMPAVKTLSRNAARNAQCLPYMTTPPRRKISSSLQWKWGSKAVHSHTRILLVVRTVIHVSLRGTGSPRNVNFSFVNVWRFQFFVDQCAGCKNYILEVDTLNLGRWAWASWEIKLLWKSRAFVNVSGQPYGPAWYNRKRPHLSWKAKTLVLHQTIRKMLHCCFIEKSV